MNMVIITKLNELANIKTLIIHTVNAKKIFFTEKFTFYGFSKYLKHQRFKPIPSLFDYLVFILVSLILFFILNMSFILNLSFFFFSQQFRI